MRTEAFSEGFLSSRCRCLKQVKRIILSKCPFLSKSSLLPQAFISIAPGLRNYSNPAYTKKCQRCRGRLLTLLWCRGGCTVSKNAFYSVSVGFLLQNFLFCSSTIPPSSAIWLKMKPSQQESRLQVCRQKSWASVRDALAAESTTERYTPESTFWKLVLSKVLSPDELNSCPG